MPFVITDPCIDTKDQACVSVCPVDCIHFEDGDRMLYINPSECIDCGACQPACPVSAIFPDSAVPDASKKFIQINELWYADKAAARSMVGGGSGAPAAPAAEAGHSPAAAPAAAAAAPAAKEEKADEPPPVLQVPATKGVHEPAISTYKTPSPASIIALTLFAAVYALGFIFPGPAIVVVGDLTIGVVTVLALVVSLVFLLGFLVNQARDLSRFAARQRREKATWRGLRLEWRRNEESRRYNLAETVNAIARERFAFPNDENPDLRTYVNLPEPTMAIEPRGTGEKVFPDIVAVAYPGNYPVAIAQVESKETVSLDQAKHVWSRLQAKDTDLYLYVPAGSLAEAKDFAKVAGVKGARFRTWRWSPNGMIVREV